MKSNCRVIFVVCTRIVRCFRPVAVVSTTVNHTRLRQVPWPVLAGKSRVLSRALLNTIVHLIGRSSCDTRRPLLVWGALHAETESLNFVCSTPTNSKAPILKFFSPN